MPDLPKAGIELVAENLPQFIVALERSTKAVQDFAQTTGLAIQQVNGAVNNIDTTGASGEIQNVATELSRIEEPANLMATVVSGAMERIGGAVVEFVMANLQKVGQFLKEAPQAAEGFQSAMFRFFAVADEGARNMKPEMEDLILMLGKELPVSTRDVAEAATELAKGGLTAATLKAGALRDSINFANAANLGLAEAGTIVVKQLGTFVKAGASAEEQAKFMAQSMDLMVKAANTSSVDVDELARGLLSSGGTAKAVGLDYEQFVGTMGALSPAFQSSSEAGTSFKNFLLRLQPQSDKAYEQMSKLGLVSTDATKILKFMQNEGIKPLGTDINVLTGQVAEYLSSVKGMKGSDIEKMFKTDFNKNEFYDANGNLKSMTEISGLLQKSLAGLSNEQRSQALSTIFGNDAMNAAVRLADLGAEGFAGFMEQMKKANGVAGMYNDVMQGAEMAGTNLEGSLEALQLAIGRNFLPYTEKLYNFGNDIVTVFLNMALAAQGNTKSMSELSAPMQEIVKYITQIDDAWNILQAAFKGRDIQYALNTLPESMQSIILSIIDLVDWWKEMNSETGTFTSITEEASWAFDEFTGYVEDLLPAFQPLINAIINLGPKILYLATAILPLFGWAWKNIVQFAYPVGELFKSVLPAAIEFFAYFIEIYSNNIIKSVDGMIIIFQTIEPIVHTSFASIVNNVTAFVATIIEVLRFLGRSIYAIINGDTAALGQIWTDFITRMNSIWTNWWLGAQQIFYQALNYLNGLTTQFITWWLQQWINSAYNLGATIGWIAKTIKESITNAINNIIWLFTKAPDEFIAGLDKFPKKMWTWITETWIIIKKYFSDIFTWDSVGQNMTKGIIDSLWANMKKVFNSFVEFAKKIIEAFNKGLESASPSKAMIRSTKNITDGIIVGLNKHQDAVFSTMDKLSSEIVVTANDNFSRAPIINNIYNTNSNSNAYNLGVTTNSSASDVISNFNLLKVST